MSEYQRHIVPTPELIRQYLEGTLDDKTMHALERQALNDPFLAEALEGFAARPSDQQSALDELHRRLELRVAPTKVRRLDYRWVAAAAILLLISVGGLMYINRAPVPAGEVAQSRSIIEPDSAADRQTDSVPAPSTAAVQPPVTKNATTAKDSQLVLADGKAVRQVARTKKKPLPANVSTEETVGDEAAKDIAKAKKAPLPASAPPQEASKGQAYAKAAIAEASIPEKIDTIRIGRLATDTTAYALAPATRMDGRRVEGVVSGQPLKYRGVTDKYAEGLISGVVVDKATGQRMPGVFVEDMKTGKSTVTDTAGTFALAVGPRKDKVGLNFSQVGYEKNNLTVAPNANNLNVQMRFGGQTLNQQIMIRGNSSAPQAHPSVSSEEYRAYLESRKKNVVPGLLEEKEGVVGLSFTVNPDSTLSDFKVIVTMGPVADRIAIRTVQEGPKWVPSPDGKVITGSVAMLIQLLRQE